MAQQVREVMTKDVVALDTSKPVAEAARRMRDGNIGGVLVMDNGRLHGIVTDRDIVVRCVADGGDPSRMTLGAVCSKDLRTLRPDDDVNEAVKLVRENAVRRIPVIGQDGKPVGLVSLGDLAQRLDRESALGQVSAAPPNR